MAPARHLLSSAGSAWRPTCSATSAPTPSPALSGARVPSPKTSSIPPPSTAASGRPLPKLPACVASSSPPNTTTVSAYGPTPSAPTPSPTASGATVRATCCATFPKPAARRVSGWVFISPRGTATPPTTAPQPTTRLSAKPSSTRSATTAISSSSGSTGPTVKARPDANSNTTGRSSTLPSPGSSHRL